MTVALLATTWLVISGVLGVFFGGFLAGAFTMAIMAAASRADDQAESDQARRD